MPEKNIIIPIFIPHKGCPNDCYFCNQKKITGTNFDISTKDIINHIESYLKTIEPHGNHIEIAYFGGSFTAIELSTQEKLLSIAYLYKCNQRINAIRISTRPDAISENILDMLVDFGVDIVELGVQSMDDEVLSKINRGHTSNDVKKASHLIKKRNITLGHQIMPGLYGSSINEDINTAIRSATLLPDIARIYPTLVIRDTQFERLYEQNRYHPLKLDESIELVSQIYAIYEQERVKVIRVGLQPTLNMTFGKDIIAGPFHPSYRQMVMTNIYVTSLIHCIKGGETNKLTIRSSEKNYNYIVGLNKQGLKRLIKSLNIENMSYIKDNSICFIEVYTNHDMMCFSERDLVETFYLICKEREYVSKRDYY
ncbi:MAG: BioB/LipA-like protein [Clostridiales bacterium 38_11]|nr:MAG: BioB/LipA-like protein [Clostridiales bacterium 38_11]HBH12122.1 radical SAM protein [Clostridiales bacterium]